jgi:hypothetical protein
MKLDHSIIELGKSKTFKARLGVEHGPNWLVYNQQKQPEKLDWCFQVFVILRVQPKNISQNRMMITIPPSRDYECVETTNQQLSVRFLGPSFIYPSELFWVRGCRIALSLRAICCIRESMVVRATDFIDLNRPGKMSVFSWSLNTSLSHNISLLLGELIIIYPLVNVYITMEHHHF